MLPFNYFNSLDYNKKNNKSSLQHKMIFNNIHNIEPFISGKCDKIEALKQSIYKILNTQRYKYIIYSWNYGIEIDDLFGKPINYILPTIQIRIEEALLTDDRILSVSNFVFNTNVRNIVSVSFDVLTIFGIVPIYNEFNINL